MRDGIPPYMGWPSALVHVVAIVTACYTLLELVRSCHGR